MLHSPSFLGVQHREWLKPMTTRWQAFPFLRVHWLMLKGCNCWLHSSGLHLLVMHFTNIWEAFHDQLLSHSTGSLILIQASILDRPLQMLGFRPCLINNLKSLDYNYNAGGIFPCCFFSYLESVQFIQSCPTLCDPMNHSTPGLPIHYKFPEYTQTHAHRVGDAIKASHPLSSPSPLAPNTSQHQGLFQWINPSHEVAKVLEFQLQHHSFQWTPRTYLL